MNFKFSIFNFKFPMLILALFFIPQVIFAESRTTVDVETETGGNTVCTNGKCTTSEGKSKSRVCVNGECYESDGDLHVESSNGQTSVNIDKNSESRVVIENNSAVNTNESSEFDESVKGASSQDETAETENHDPQASDSKSGFSLVSYIKDRLSFLRELITFQFLFGDK